MFIKSNLFTSFFFPIQKNLLQSSNFTCKIFCKSSAKKIDFLFEMIEFFVEVFFVFQTIFLNVKFTFSVNLN